MENLILLPVPKMLEKLDCAAVRPDTVPKIEYDGAFGEEEYDILINCDGVFVKCLGKQGEFRAKTTLAQLSAQSDMLSCGLHIHDTPDFKHRGVMLDISRGKTPTLDTLKKIVDMLAAVKINQLQLYVEGFSFEYESFPQVSENSTPITGEEIKALDNYCRERFIELVPNQNCFGHMSPWLEREEFRGLAECPEGFRLDEWDYLGPHCLDPQNPKSFEFVKKLFDDMLPYFNSDTVNIDCDETHELGLGKSREICEKIGRHRVYVDFLKKIIAYVGRYKENIMFWGDIILSGSDDLLQELPSNVIPINWGYGKDQPSEDACRRFENAGLKFYNAPGTSSWNTILGDVDTMLENIDNAVERGLLYGAVGILNTDWGDLNHLQYLPVSYPGFVYGAAKSWNAAADTRDLLAPYLNRFVFKDSSNRFAQLLLRAGRYHSVADFSNTLRGLIIGVLYYPLEGEKWESLGQGFEKEEIDKLLHELELLRDGIGEVKLECADDELVKRELLNGIRIVEFACYCALYKSKQYIGGQNAHKDMLLSLQTVFLEEHTRLWLARNRSGGLENSIRRMKKIDMPLSEFGKFYPFSDDYK